MAKIAVSVQTKPQFTQFCFSLKIFTLHMSNTIFQEITDQPQAARMEGGTSHR